MAIVWVIIKFFYIGKISDVWFVIICRETYESKIVEV